MKKLIQIIAFAGLSFTLFCCNKPSEPQPAQDPQQAVMARANGLANPEQSLINYRSPWTLVKTVTPVYSKGQNLSTPFATTADNLGDISWGSYGCYSAIIPVKVMGYNLKVVSVSSITLAYLKTLTFNNYAIANAPDGSQYWTNYMPVKTVIACKTAAGRYYLIEIVADSPLTLNIYHSLVTI